MTDFLTAAWLDEARVVLDAQCEQYRQIRQLSAFEVVELLDKSCFVAFKFAPSADELAFIRSCERRLKARLGAVVERYKAGRMV